MQVVINVQSSGSRSLRDAIVSSPHALEEAGLEVVHEKRASRSRGWAKLRATDRAVTGVLNLEWHAATKTLIARTVFRSRARRELIVAMFLYFLFSSFPSRVRAVTVFRT
jgi:hypothetical protein